MGHLKCKLENRKQELRAEGFERKQEVGSVNWKKGAGGI